MVAVLGPGRCGKTSWLVRGIDSLRAREGCRFLLEGQEAQWQSQLQGLNLARGTAPTPEVPGTAWCLGVGKNGTERGVYLHEVAGGECPDADRLARYASLRRLDGVVVVVDPFGFAPVRQRHGALVQQLRPPVEPAATFVAGQYLPALFEALERLQSRRSGGRWDLAVAVVVTKLDVLGLYRELGDEQAATAAVGEACRARLTDWGFDETMRGLEGGFRRVRCFASMPRGSGGFSPANAIRWLLNP